MIAQQGRSLTVSILLLCGITLLAFFANDLYWNIASANWPKTSGVVLISNTRHSQSRSGNNTKHTYHVDVAYRYEIAGKLLKGTRIAFFEDTYNSQYSAEQVQLAHFQPGMSVEVFYHPDHPENSVLRPLTWNIGAVLPFAGMALCILAFVRLLIPTAKIDEINSGESVAGEQKSDAK